MILPNRHMYPKLKERVKHDDTKEEWVTFNISTGSIDRNKVSQRRKMFV